MFDSPLEILLGLAILAVIAATITVAVITNRRRK